jgi:hypothetical protein
MVPGIARAVDHQIRDRAIRGMMKPMMVPLSAETREQLRELSRRLLRLHKALLDLNRREYESDHLPPSSGTELLQLVLDDPHFAWLRTLSSLIVQLDDLTLTDELATEEDARLLVRRVHALLHASGGDAAEFGERYREALQKSPEVVVAHGQVVALLG